MRGCVSTGATLIRFYRVVMRRKEEVRWDGGVPAGRRTNEPLTEGAEHLHWWDAHILQPDVGKDASVISPSATKCRSCRSSVRRSAVTWLDSQEHDGERGVQRGGDWEHEGGGRREVKTSLLIAQSQLEEARGRRWKHANTHTESAETFITVTHSAGGASAAFMCVFLLAGGWSVFQSVHFEHRWM